MRISDIMTVKSLLLIILLTTQAVNAAKILFIPSMWASHITEAAPLAGELIKRGHDVHMLMVSTAKKMPPSLLNTGVKFVTYDVSYDVDPFDDQLLINMTLENKDSGNSWFNEFDMDAILGKRECAGLFENDKVFQKVKSMDFDLAIMDSFGVTLCRYVLPYQLGIPYGSITAVMWPHMPSIMTLPSVNVALYGKYVDTFAKRLNNIYAHTALAIATYLLYDREIYHGSYTPDRPYTSLIDLARKSQFWLIETDGSLDYLRARPPNVFYVGGLTTRPAQPLKDGPLKNFADGAKDGLIVVSFGTRVTHLEEDAVNKLMTVFNNLKYRVVFRYEGKVETAKNVMTVKWMPQNNLLGHRNTILFITHCGNNGRYEALYHGVPMIGFPFDADQPINAEALVDKGQGLRMDIKSFTAEELASAIKEVLENPRYRQNIQRASAIFHSRPMNPREEAAFVVEQVLKYGGDHLQTHATDMDLYQICMLDVLGLIIVIFSLVIFIFYFMCKCCCSLFKRKPKEKTS